MVFITYSQQKQKPIYQDRVKRIFNLVKTKSTPDLWIKVLIRVGDTKLYYLNYERDNQQKEFWFGRRFNFDDVKKQYIFEVNINNGHYRYAEVFGHGFYEEEWKFINKHSKIKHVITLKISTNASDEDIAELMAHEFRHYLQYKKYGLSMTRHGNSGRRSRPIQVERDANKWAKKRVQQLKEKGLL